MARFFIEKINKIKLVKNTTTLEQPLKDFTESIYSLFSKELKEEDFYELESLEDQANELKREEKFLSELKDEMNVSQDKENEPSKSFTKVQKTASFK